HHLLGGEALKAAGRAEWWELVARKGEGGRKKEGHLRSAGSHIDRNPWRIWVMVPSLRCEGEPPSVYGLDWDDIVANLVAILPKVLSPRKVEVIERNRNEKLPRFYSNLEKMTTTEAGTGEADNGKDDDDLFVDNVDKEVVDEGITKGRKNRKGKKATGSKGKGPVIVDQECEELSTDEDDLLVDIQNPIFKVGMLFESVELLRKAITEYNLKKRVDIKMPRNERKRLRANCADGCPWSLYASNDSRTNGLVKHWVLKRCTSKWLAKKYLESFIADQKISLSNFARIVQKEWNMTHHAGEIIDDDPFISQ
uniref:Transposase MuDR plant domain-containing protein n=1 Tax=Setaria italica TaxID=4555 RepID=K3YMM0_SETIT